jgi:hypothetical protein
LPVPSPVAPKYRLPWSGDLEPGKPPQRARHRVGLTRRGRTTTQQAGPDALRQTPEPGSGALYRFASSCSASISIRRSSSMSPARSRSTGDAQVPNAFAAACVSVPLRDWGQLRGRRQMLHMCSRLRWLRRCLRRCWRLGRRFLSGRCLAQMLRDDLACTLRALTGDVQVEVRQLLRRQPQRTGAEVAARAAIGVRIFQHVPEGRH